MHPFIEENISSTSSENKKNNNPIIKKENNDLIIDLSHKNIPKKDQDDISQNSAEFSNQILDDENKNIKKYKSKTERPKILFRTKKDYERYEKKIKENTMRLELEKINKETERFAKEYEEKYSYKHIFNNNPQFQKLLKSVQNQLILIFILSFFILILCSMVYFNFTKKKLGISLVNMILSVSEISIILVLIISLKIGLLNDPDLSKAIRLFILIEFILQIVTFIFNIIIPFLMHDYLYKHSKFTMVIIYLLFILILLLTIFSFKFCFILLFESLLILLNKKTEYAILMINEKNNKNSRSMDISINNNISTVGLNQTESNLIMDNEKKIKTDKDDEKYRSYYYFNRFHSSITTDRKEPNYFKK